MPAWEAIVEEYLEGTGSRAAAESLRFRIALPSAARWEVETVLRLADRLADATHSVRPPAGAADRLGNRLLLAGRPEVHPKWVQEGSDFIAPKGVPRLGADEDAANAVIEGTLDLAPTITIGRGDAENDLNAFKSIAAAIRREEPSPAAGSIPAGAIGRLRSKLAADQGEGGASPVVAARILAQMRGEAAAPSRPSRPPDVLAAGEETETGDEAPDDPDEPSDT